MSKSKQQQQSKRRRAASRAEYALKPLDSERRFIDGYLLTAPPALPQSASGGRNPPPALSQSASRESHPTTPIQRTERERLNRAWRARPPESRSSPLQDSR